MLVIGLTGGIGSGKSTVAALFAAKGINVIDTDKLARVLTEPGQPAFEQIKKKFGEGVILKDGFLNRSALRQLIFKHPEYKEWLENLLHPLIREELKNQIQTSNSPYCIAVIPLLFETTPNPLIDRILVVDTAVEHQIARTQARDNASLEEVETIIKTQVSRQERLSKAHDIIHNHGPLEELSSQVEKLHQYYLTL